MCDHQHSDLLSLPNCRGNTVLQKKFRFSRNSPESKRVPAIMLAPNFPFVSYTYLVFTLNLTW